MFSAHKIIYYHLIFLKNTDNEKERTLSFHSSLSEVFFYGSKKIFLFISTAISYYIILYLIVYFILFHSLLHSSEQYVNGQQNISKNA